MIVIDLIVIKYSSANTVVYEGARARLGEGWRYLPCRKQFELCSIWNYYMYAAHA